MVNLERHKDCFWVYIDHLPAGIVELYHNPYHLGNCYLKLNLSCYLHEISKELFSKIAQEVQKPLQIMISSKEEVQIAFLQAGGFSCRRKCYEVEAGSDDLMGGFPKEDNCRLLQCVRGSREYAQCCKLMYNAYIQNHALVNPWTAEFEIFCEKLPAHVFYSEREGEIFGLAFVEDNEIAYLWGKEPMLFPAFAAALTARLLEENEKIFFECDDCDWAAMALRSMFKNQGDESYHTYIRNDHSVKKP